MTNKEKILISNLLGLASDVFTNHGCNDLEPNIFIGWTKQEIMNLYVDIFGPNEDELFHADINCFGDSLLMSHFAVKLKEEANNGHR